MCGKSEYIREISKSPPKEKQYPDKQRSQLQPLTPSMSAAFKLIPTALCPLIPHFLSPRSPGSPGVLDNLPLFLQNRPVYNEHAPAKQRVRLTHRFIHPNIHIGAFLPNEPIWVCHPSPSIPGSLFG